MYCRFQARKIINVFEITSAWSKMKDCPLLLSWLACCKINKQFALHILPGINQTVDIQLPICIPCMHACRLQEGVHVCFCMCMHAQIMYIADFCMLQNE